MGDAGRKFRIGDRVRTTVEWKRRAQPKVWPEEGTVCGFSRDGRLVRVKRDAVKRASSYHPDFWVLAAHDQEPQ